MRKLFILILLMMLFNGCSTREEIKKVEYKKITASEAKAIMDNEENIIILDVRTESEFKEGYIKNAILIPDNEIKSKAELTLYNKNEKILVYCRSGRRSEIASRQLISMGYTNIFDFGGIIDWKYEIVK